MDLAKAVLETLTLLFITTLAYTILWGIVELASRYFAFMV